MIKMTPEDFLNTGILEEYVLGLLSEKEADQVVEYISKHPKVKNAYDELQNTIFQLAESHGIKPPQHVRARVMQKIKSDNIATNTPKSSSWTTYITAAAAVVLGVISLLSYNKISTLDQQLNDQKQAYTVLANHCEEESKKYEQQSKIFAFYKDINTESVILKGNERLPKFELASKYNKNTNKLMLSMANKTKIGDDKVLCLWGDKDGKMILITKLEPASLGSIIPFDGAMNSLNVTLENQREVIDHPDVSQLIASATI